MARVNTWFCNFFTTFKEGESRISEKQFNVFAKYLDEEFRDGYISGYRDTVEGYTVKAYRWDCKGGVRYYLEKCKAGTEPQKKEPKMYYFSFNKHGHDLEFRRNRLKNTIDDMLASGIVTDWGKVEEMEDEIEKINEIFTYWDGNPASKLPADLYQIANNAAIWASETRVATCIENGRTDLIQYC